MKDESREILDSLLADWHMWASGYSPSTHGTAPMFGQMVSSRQWDSEDDVLDSNLHRSQMRTVDFCISELEPLHRTAIDIQARNLVTGRSVWTSARLPQDVERRAVIVADARIALTKRLATAGVL